MQPMFLWSCRTSHRHIPTPRCEFPRESSHDLWTLTCIHTPCKPNAASSQSRSLYGLVVPSMLLFCLYIMCFGLCFYEWGFEQLLALSAHHQILMSLSSLTFFIELIWSALFHTTACCGTVLIIWDAYRIHLWCWLVSVRYKRYSKVSIKCRVLLSIQFHQASAGQSACKLIGLF